MATSPSPSQYSIGGTSPNSSSPTSQRSGYPFPTQELHRRQPSINAYRPRRGSTASNTSVGGSLDIQSRRGSTVRETSQNAISTLLQPPIVRSNLLPHTAVSTGFKAPTTKDIPPVALTNIPHLGPETFREYLHRIGPLFESFQRGRADPEAQSTKKEEKTDRFAEALEQPRGSTSPTAHRRAASTLSPLETPTSTTSRRLSRRNRNEPTPLSTIPTVYFDDNFHLENPRTFDTVSERAEIIRPVPGTPQGANGAPRKPLSTNAILQEKLSWYMDTVEVHLINSIGAASTGFFAALGSLKALQAEAEASVQRIQSLREDLRRLDREVAVAGLEVAGKRRRAANVGKLGQASRQVQRVVEEVKRVDGLVEEGEYDRAAEGMDGVGRLVCGQGEEAGLIDLRPLKALQGLDTGLQDLQSRIGTGFANRFVNVLLADLRQHVGRVPTSDTLKRWSRQRGIQPTYLECPEHFRRDLMASLRGLQRAGHMAPATTAYREAVMKEMKRLIQKHLPSSDDGDADSTVSTATSTRSGSTNKLSRQEKSSILARNLRALDAEDAEAMLVNIYTSVGEALRRISTQTKILLDVTSSMLPPTEARSPGPRSPLKSPAIGYMDEQITTNGVHSPRNSMQYDGEDLSQALDLSSLLGQAVDEVQKQITKMLKVRNEQTIRLEKDRFLRYFALNRLFADECEAVSGMGGQALKGLINAQISGFVQVLGTLEQERIGNLLDRENWSAVDFTTRGEEMLQRVLGSMSQDPPEWLQRRALWEDPFLPAQQTNGEAPAMTNGTSTPTPKPTATRPANIDGSRYLLVCSAGALLPSIETFLSLTPHLPSLTPQISTALLDTLRLFNSRTLNLVLFAGATRSTAAGLKNITTKHLALASQALSFIVALVPYMRECCRRHFPAGQAGGSGSVLAEFDKTKRLFQDHQVQIQDKLVEIMLGRSRAHVRSLFALDFTEVGKDGGAVSAYMETLTKETLTLHRVLARHLSEGDVGMVMRRVGEGYEELWCQAYKEVELGTGGKGGEVLVRDAEAFGQRLGGLEGFKEVGEKVLVAAKARGAGKKG